MQIKNCLLSILAITCSLMVNYAQTDFSSDSTSKNQRTEREAQKTNRKTTRLDKQQVALHQDEEGKDGEDKAFQAKSKEQRELELENNLIRTRLERELATLRAEIEKLRVQKELATLKWELEQAQNTQEFEKQMLVLNRQRDKILAEVALSQAKLAQAMEQFNTTYAQAQNQVMLLRANVEHVRAEVDEKKTKEERAAYADTDPIYSQEPLLPDGTLIVSDRSVSLNGVVTSWKADYIVDRIRYFNNKDNKKPIFIIIGNCPGGSGDAGVRILQTVQNSQAPVYVVVKSFAASMAALIATLAKKSYAYPNAMILHHQPWTFTCGNVRELKEELEYLKEWWKRFGGQVAKKMGISLEKLDKELYDKSANGNWMEFGDNAKKIKWVDHIITDINDTGVQKMPDPANYTWRKYYCEYQHSYDDMIDKSGEVNNATIYLPPLAPKDFYYLYNPNNVYQLPTNK